MGPQQLSRHPAGWRRIPCRRGSQKLLRQHLWDTARARALGARQAAAPPKGPSATAPLGRRARSLTPRPGPGAGSRRQPAGRAGGRATPTCIRTRGGTRSAWRPPPGCCTKKAVGYAIGATTRGTGPWCTRPSTQRPAGARRGETRRSTPPRTRGTPVHLRPARRPPGEPRHSPSGRAGLGRAGRAPGRKPAGARPQGTTEPTPIAHHKKQDHPGHRPPQADPGTHKSDTAPPHPRGHRTPGEADQDHRTTEQQAKQPETPLSELSETRPAVHPAVHDADDDSSPPASHDGLIRISRADYEKYFSHTTIGEAP